MSRRAAALLALVSAALVLGPAAAQSPSGPPSPTGPPPATPVTLTGVIQRADGRPAAGVPIALSRRVGGGEILLDLFSLTFTGGLAALDCALSGGDSAIVEICRTGVFTTRTDRAGRFRLDLTASEARTNTGTSRFALSTSLATRPGERAAPSIIAPLNLDQREVLLPPLRFWETRPTLAAAGNDARLSGAPPVGDVYSVTPLAVSSRVVDATGRTIMFEEELPTEFDLRRLEDLRVEAGAAAHGTLYFEGGKTNVTYLTGRTAYTGALRPPSRGAGCSASTTRGEEGRAGCWVTDGRYVAAQQAPLVDCRPAEVFPQANEECLRHRVLAVTVDLRRTIDVGFVVIPGCAELACTVEGSTDNRDWTPLVHDGDVSPAVSARFVRVSLPGTDRRPEVVERGRDTPLGEDPLAGPATGPPGREGGHGDLSVLTEVSVWEGGQPAPAASGAPRVPSGGGRAEPGPGASEARGAAVLIAVLALTGVLAGRVAVARRRRPATPAGPVATGGGDPYDVWRPPS